MAREITYILSTPLEDVAKTGGAIYTKNVIYYLASKGMSIDIVTLQDFSRCSRRNYFWANVAFIKLLLAQKRAKKLIIEDFYMHPWLFIFNWICRLFKNKRIIIFVQLLYYFQQKNKLLNYMDKLVSKMCLLSAHMVIVNSKTTAGELQSIGINAKKIRVIYPGCDFLEGNHIEIKASRDKKNSNNRFHVLAISNYEYRKGLHDLVEAASIMKRTNPIQFEKMVINIVGNPEVETAYTEELYRSIAQNNLRERVFLLGWKSREELRSLYSDSDLFVFPSTNEGFGMVLAEAMFYGLPIIAANAGASPELIEDGYNGILVTPKDPAEIAGAIMKLILDIQLRNFMGINSLKKSNEVVHSWDEVCHKFHQVLLEVAQ